ncbi:unnamed protein product [Ixodes hexagonus]
MSKDQICMALRTYDYDVNATITAISENGPEEALREWNCAGNKVKPPSRNRKRKKKKRDTTAGLVSEGPDVGAGDEARKDSDSGRPEEEEKTGELPPADSPPDGGDAFSCDKTVAPPGGAWRYPPGLPAATAGSEPIAYTVSGTPKCRKQSLVLFCVIRSKPNHSHNGSRSKSSRSKNGPDAKLADSSVTTTSTLPKKTCLEKSLKDLSRQTVALQRVQVLLEDELHKAERAIKAAFAEVQKLLNDRQAQLEAEMEKVKTDARAMLQRRQKLAAELKARSEMASTLPDYELMELRDDIKHFVVERKYDEELGKTVRFNFSKDRVEREIKELGQAVHVKDPYTCRRLSLSSGASSSYPDSSYQISAASSPVSRSQYYTFETMREEDGSGRRQEACPNNHRTGYRGYPPAMRSGGYPRGGRNRRSDDVRYNRGDRGAPSGRAGHCSGRSHRYSSGTGRGRYTGEVSRRPRDDENNRKPSPERVNGRA